MARERRRAELAANVWRLWLVLGDVADGRQLVAAALDVGEARPSRARALALYGGEALAGELRARGAERCSP